MRYTYRIKYRGKINPGEKLENIQKTTTICPFCDALVLKRYGDAPRVEHSWVSQVQVIRRLHTWNFSPQWIRAELNMKTDWARLQVSSCICLLPVAASPHCCSYPTSPSSIPSCPVIFNIFPITFLGTYTIISYTSRVSKQSHRRMRNYVAIRFAAL